MGERTVGGGADAIVEAMAHLLTCGGVSDMTARLEGGATGSALSGHGCSAWSDGIGLSGPKWMTCGAPNQDIFFHLIPWDMSKQVVTVNAHSCEVGACMGAENYLVLY